MNLYHTPGMDLPIMVNTVSSHRSEKLPARVNEKADYGPIMKDVFVSDNGKILGCYFDRITKR